MTKTKKRAIKKHINSKINEFKAIVLKTALEEEHPFIEKILEKALAEYQKDAKEKCANITDDERVFLTFP